MKAEEVVFDVKANQEAREKKWRGDPHVEKKWAKKASQTNPATCMMTFIETENSEEKNWSMETGN